MDAETEPELLLWALRGGGGNFGIVTRLKYRLDPVDTVVGGVLVLPATREVITGFVAEAEAAPDELAHDRHRDARRRSPSCPRSCTAASWWWRRWCYAGDVEAGAAPPSRPSARWPSRSPTSCGR